MGDNKIMGTDGNENLAVRVLEGHIRKAITYLKNRIKRWDCDGKIAL
jgi:hypothetical protein